MNRVERRKLQKKMKNKNTVINPGSEPIDRSDPIWCWLHELKLENIDRPTERDKKLIESTRLIPYKNVDKNGIINRGKICGRCGNAILIKDTNEGASLEGFTTK